MEEMVMMEEMEVMEKMGQLVWMAVMVRIRKYKIAKLFSAFTIYNW